MTVGVSEMTAGRAMLGGLAVCVLMCAAARAASSLCGFVLQPAYMYIIYMYIYHIYV